MSILENNFNQACKAMSELVEQEKKEKNIQQAKFIIVQVAHNDESFEFLSATLTPAKSEAIPAELDHDKYYNMIFVAEGVDEILKKFKDKYLFKLAYADISFALHSAYRHALMSETGEYALNTSFFKPGIKDSTWAYKEVFHYSDLGLFRCWFNFDEEFKEVNIQADNDLIEQYNKLEPAEVTKL